MRIPGRKEKQVCKADPERIMRQKKKAGTWVEEYFALTLAVIVLVIGIYFFKFPNHFSFGGVTGIAVLLGEFFPLSASTLTFIMNMLLLIVGFLFLGKEFGIKTVYVSVLSSAGLELLDRYMPLRSPLTDQPVLELIFAIILPAVSAAVFFYYDASGGGTDIVAMIVKKYSDMNIAMALFLVDLLISVSAWFVFDAQTGLFSFCGLMAKSLVIDGVIENMNLCKYLTIICSEPEPICRFIQEQLHRSSTIFKAKGSYSHNDKTIVLTVMKRKQAIRLEHFIRQQEAGAFIMVTNSSEIIGNGFHGFH